MNKEEYKFGFIFMATFIGFWLVLNIYEFIINYSNSVEISENRMDDGNASDAETVCPYCGRAADISIPVAIVVADII